MHADTWATLPCDLLVEILRRLGPTSTTVIRSAAVCRPWRRAIIDNTRCLRVRPDRFLPHLLLTFVDRTWRSEDVIALKGVGVDVGLYNTPLSSRDGFLLLAGDTVNSLCLCNPFAGTCRCLPAAAFGVSKNKCTYVLATDDEHDDPEVRILAVEGENIKDGMPYQVFSSTSGAWGPVTRSGKFELHVDLAQVYMFPEPKHVVVCRDSVYWIVIAITTDRGAWMCMFAIDMRTGDTWTTELPESCGMAHCFPCDLVLATSGDSRQLSMVALKGCRWIEVWVLVGDSWWTLRRTMDIERMLLQNCPSMTYVWLSGFCPRSGCLFGVVKVDQDLNRYFLVGVDGTSPRLIETLDSNDGYRFPYEMDWSTYISNMKYF